MLYRNLEKRPYRATLKPEAKAKILVGFDAIWSPEGAGKSIWLLARWGEPRGLETSSLQS